MMRRDRDRRDDDSDTQRIANHKKEIPMCDFLSAFIHDDAATMKIEKRYLFGDLQSHSSTMKLCKQQYGRSDKSIFAKDSWRELEWTGEKPDSLVVRDVSD
jgi:hypothetical protein